MRLVLSILIVLSSNTLHSFTIQRTSKSSYVKWQRSLIDYKINIDNKTSLTDATITSIINSSFDEWQGTPTLTKSYTTSTERSNQNDIYFADDSLFFSGSSVLAVTKNIFNEVTGEIVESDIIIKNNIFLNNSTNSSYYLGNIITHELGHSLGLGHSNELFSTMFYSVTRGQFTNEHDDEHGHRFLYGSETSFIKGKVAGSSEAFPVFGATVRLISSLKGRVIASTLSEEDGSFIFRDIDLNDVYYVYISPTTFLSPLPRYYSSARSDFCSGFASYQGGFYETCDAKRRGRPQGVKISSSQKNFDLGTISIKCQQDVPLDYFNAKSISGFDLSDNALTPGESIVGFFTKQEILAGALDTFQMDLTSYNINESDLYLDVNIVTHDLYSNAAFDLTIESPVTSAFFTDSINSDGNPYLNIKGSFPLDASINSNNIFTITVKPKTIANYLLTSGFSSVNEVFPGFVDLGTDKALYQLVVQIKRKEGLNYVIYDTYDYDNGGGNLACMQGEKTYRVRNPASAITDTSSEVGEAGAVACGSVSIASDDDGPSGGIMQVMIGFLLMLMMNLCPLRKAIHRFS